MGISKPQIPRNKSRYCRDLTTDKLCRLGVESQHSQQGENGESHKGGDPTREEQKMLTIAEWMRIPLKISVVINRDGRATIMVPWEDERKNALDDGQEGRWEK